MDRGETPAVVRDGRSGLALEAPATKARRVGLWLTVAPDRDFVAEGSGVTAAEAAAARAALGLAEAPGAARAIDLENLRDHAMKLGVVWPARLGLPAGRAMTEALGLAALDGGRAVSSKLFGASPPPRRLRAFERWLGGGETPAARLFAHVWARWDGRRGRMALRPLGPWAASSEIDFMAAAVDGEPVDASVAARTGDDHLMREIEARRGRGVVWRMAARLVDLERLLDRLAGPEEGGRALSPRPGLGWVEGAEGATLVRAAAVEGGVIALQRLTPLDFARHPRGVAVRLRASMPAHADPALSFLSLDSASALGSAPWPSG